jgi:hypothetical protein
MSSTPFAYPQVISRRFASFRVVDFSISAFQRDFWGGFDSRQLQWHRHLPCLELAAPALLRRVIRRAISAVHGRHA